MGANPAATAGTLGDKLPLLVTGLAGVPGLNSFFYFRKKYGMATVGIKPGHTAALDYPEVFGISAEDRVDLDRLFDAYRFKTVIDASGCCALKSCEYNPRLARLINEDFGRRVGAQAQRFGARLIRLSTDLVFDGAGAGGYREEDAPSPITVYGKTMARAEQAILQECPEATVLRISLPMGPSLNGHAGAVDWIEHRFARGNPATLYYDEVRSNLYVQDLVAVLEFFVDNLRPGLFHVGGPRPLSLFQIGQVVNRLGDYPAALLKGAWRREAGPVPPRVGDVTMDSAKLGRVLPSGTIKPWPFKEAHVPEGRAWHAARPEPGGAELLKEALYGYQPESDPRNPLHWHRNPDYL